MTLGVEPVELKGSHLQPIGARAHAGRQLVQESDPAVASPAAAATTELSVAGMCGSFLAASDERGHVCHAQAGVVAEVVAEHRKVSCEQQAWVHLPAQPPSRTI